MCLLLCTHMRMIYCRRCLFDIDSIIFALFVCFLTSADIIMAAEVLHYNEESW